MTTHSTSNNSEKLFKTAADVIASEGYKDVGYEYVIIDDCWLEFERDNVTDELVPDRKRFPNGIKALADYVRSINFFFIRSTHSLLSLLFKRFIRKA